MTTMAIYDADEVDVAGNVQVAIGPGFANINAPKLSELTLQITCPIRGGIKGTTDVKTKSRQKYCDLFAKEGLESRTRKLDELTVLIDAKDRTKFDAIVAEDKTIGLFQRPLTSSKVALAVGDKGVAYQARISAIDYGSNDIGDQWTYVIKLLDVDRSPLNVALA